MACALAPTLSPPLSRAARQGDEAPPTQRARLKGESGAIVGPLSPGSLGRVRRVPDSHAFLLAHLPATLRQ